MQKSMKHCKKKARHDVSIFISVCAMREITPGMYSSARAPCIEIRAKKGDNYETFCEKAAKACKLQEKPSQEFCLFKMNGAQILNEPLTSAVGKEKGWTIGNYLTAIKKGSGNTKIGIGYTKLDFTELESTSSKTGSKRDRVDEGSRSSDQFFDIRVMYYNPPRSAARDSTVRKALTRSYIWGCIKGSDPSSIGVYQPEDDGYKVLSIYKGDHKLLTSSCGGTYTEESSSTTFEILWQSPKKVSISSTRIALPLCCIGSMHGQCSYVWHRFGNSQRFPSTPVIYMNEGGLYQCKVVMRSESVSGNIINVTVTVDSDSDIPLITHISPPVKKRKCGTDTSKVTSSDQRQENENLTVYDESQHDDHEQNEGDISDRTSKVLTPYIGTDQTLNRSQGKISLWDAAADFGASVDINKADTPVKGTVIDVKQKTDSKALHHEPHMQVREFCINDIKSATGNFSNISILGKGGFGIVYLGFYKGTKVAIKKLTENAAINFAKYEGKEVPDKFTLDGQLSCEMWALTRCRHRNLIDLMGYCTKPPCLIYEFMEQGNLYDRLHKKSPVLTIQQRSRILKDACRGLAWLHSMEPPIMHGDIKTRNILLEHHLTAKLGDFGFTQEIPRLTEGRSVITVAIVAKSLGYSPPEMDTAHVSCKSDMYCYGVVGLEVFTGKPPYCKDWDDPKLVEHVDDKRETIEGHKQIYDQTAGEIPHYLLLIYRKMIEACLMKHSRRCTSGQVMDWWLDTNY